MPSKTSKKCNCECHKTTKVKRKTNNGIAEVGREIQSIVKKLKVSYPDMSHKEAMKQAGMIYKQKKYKSV